MNKQYKENPNENIRLMSLTVKIISCIVAISVLFISRYAFVFFILGMLPTIISVLVDKRINRFASSTISAFNLIGILPFLFEIYTSRTVNETAQAMLTNTYVWFVVYASAALGWVFIIIIPQISAKLFITRAEIKVKGLEEIQAKLVEEWGKEVKNNNANNDD